MTAGVENAGSQRRKAEFAALGQNSIGDLVRLFNYASRNDMFDVGSTLVFGMFGYLLIQLRFEPAPILLGFVLGPRLDENFRRSLVLSRGSLQIFIDHPISATFLLIAAVLVAVQIYARFRRIQPPTAIASAAFD
jgi:TctA family transporter